MSATPFRLFVVAGEPSGDILAHRFVLALKAALAPRPVATLDPQPPLAAALS